MSKFKTENKSLILNSLFIILFMVAFLERTVFDFGPNIEILTSALVLSSFYFGTKRSFYGTLAVIVLSDLIIGNTNIFIFTWSGFLIPVIFSTRLIHFLKLRLKLKSIFNPLTLTLTGISTNLFFFFYTNLGVWLLDSWGMYAKNLSGLIYCYINALPFLKNQVISSIIFIPAGYILVNFVINISSKLHFNKNINSLLNRKLHHI